MKNLFITLFGLAALLTFTTCSDKNGMCFNFQLEQGVDYSPNTKGHVYLESKGGKIPALYVNDKLVLFGVEKGVYKIKRKDEFRIEYQVSEYKQNAEFICSEDYNEIECR